MLKAKRVYDPPAAADGLRVLVMRLWPRGIRKEAVDLWLKELGADLANLRAWKAGRMDWPEMRSRYVEGLTEPAAAADLARLEELARQRTVTVLCACVDERQCHRGILRDVLARRGASPSPASRRSRATAKRRSPRAAPRTADATERRRANDAPHATPRADAARRSPARSARDGTRGRPATSDTRPRAARPAGSARRRPRA